MQLKTLSTMVMVIAVGISSLGACATQPDVTIRNPVATGAIDGPNTIEHSRRNQRPVRVAFVSVSPKKVCFDVDYARRRTGELPPAAPRNQRMMMRADRGWERNVAFENTTIETTKREKHSQRVLPLMGVRIECVRRSADGACDERTIGQDSQVVTETDVTYESTVATRACFPNLGQVDNRTDTLEFRMHRLTFRWSLEGKTAAVVRHGAQVLHE